VLYSDIVLLMAILLKPETICRYYSKSKIADVDNRQSITRASTSGPSKDSQALESMEANSSVTQASPMKKRKVRE
jgi:hypothetical protein